MMVGLTFMGNMGELSGMPKLMVDDAEVLLWCHGTSKVEERTIMPLQETT